MRRLLLRITLLLTMLFTACIGLIRAQPYQEGELDTFLSPPDGCPMPCFMGIRLGVTTAEEAEAILEGHEWIGTVSRYEITGGLGVASLSASWSGMQPEMIDSTVDLNLGVRDNTIWLMSINTHVALGHVLLLRGVPEFSVAFPVSGNLLPTPAAAYESGYNNLTVFFGVFANCPIESIWKLPVGLEMRSEFSEEAEERHDMPSQVYGICRRLMNAG